MTYKNISNCKIYNYYNYLNSSIEYLDNCSLPILTYPNHQPCVEANAYMIHLYKLNFSTHDGGTLIKYASYINHLLKYIYFSNEISKFSQLDDNHFSNFIHSLISPLRSNNQVVRIGKECINFIFFISFFYSYNNLIGTISNCKIKVYINSKKKLNYSKATSRSYFHLSFPITSNPKKVYPISVEAITKIRQLIIQNYNHIIRFRNLCLLDALEQTGARRSEIIKIKVSDVMAANRIAKEFDSSPLLQLSTLKRRDGITTRKVPVPNNFINNLIKYIREFRNPILKAKGLNDHGYLFISHTTGKPLSSASITVYLNSWSKLLNSDINYHAHQFRHRFITEKFKSLIFSYNINNNDDFQKILISEYSLKLEILQWSGHSHIESLTPYLHVAISEITNIKESMDHLNKNTNNLFIVNKINDLYFSYKIGVLTESQLIFEIQQILS